MSWRMRKPQGKVKIEWSPNFAYAIGLLTTDGNLSPDGRHMTFTSKDLEQVENYQKALGIHVSVGKKSRGGEPHKKYYVVQFSDVLFYRFLESIGLMPNKSKRLKEVLIPDEYFFDFLRGHLDGDGTFYSYWDPRWKSSFMYYTVFLSASKNHIEWIRKKITQFMGIKGHLTGAGRNRITQLKFGKKDSLLLLERIYHSPHVLCLKRKHLKIMKALSILPKP